MSVGLESGQCAVVPLGGVTAVAPPLRTTVPSIGTAVDHCRSRNVITPIWTQLLCSNDHVFGRNESPNHFATARPPSFRPPVSCVARDPGHCSWCWRWLLMLLHIPFLAQICHHFENTILADSNIVNLLHFQMIFFYQWLKGPRQPVGPSQAVGWAKPSLVHRPSTLQCLSLAIGVLDATCFLNNSSSEEFVL